MGNLRKQETDKLSLLMMSDSSTNVVYIKVIWFPIAITDRNSLEIRTGQQF